MSSKIQVLDLGDDDRLLVHCTKCHHSRLISKAQLMSDKDRSRLFLDEVESRLKCRGYNCTAPVTISVKWAKKKKQF